MVSIDSCCASSMKAQVLTITVSAPSRSSATISWPRRRELAEHDLAVDEVLGAAEADHADGGGTGRGTHERTILPEPDGRAQEAAAGDATRRSSQRTSCDGGASWVMPNSVGRRGGCSSARARATQ